ncbi:DUF177 domain-containing protein [Aquabacter sp. L1I39]|uniref:YceD family protein n=1 Tax=Aquabacter sp. L1I39 TaxID=2820278 RepID=UPI001ADBCF5E|nr:YceD family protein [Aquabacter sp. L1I39]QTL02622.1 DUF177 domain-containing protein [Aquabacter sp. L1I39]
MPEIPLTHKVRIAELSPSGTTVRVVPTAEERAALARHVGVLDLLDLQLEATLVPRRDGALVTGRLKATVRVTSVVSLEPFDDQVDETFEVEFAPPEEVAAFEAAEEEDADGEALRDPPDALVDGAVDLGALATEFLSLGLDPYPRRPGEVFETHQEGPADESPFAALAKLKGKS